MVMKKNIIISICISILLVGIIFGAGSLITSIENGKLAVKDIQDSKTKPVYNLVYTTDKICKYDSEIDDFKCTICANSTYNMPYKNICIQALQNSTQTDDEEALKNHIDNMIKDYEISKVNVNLRSLA